MNPRTKKDVVCEPSPYRRGAAFGTLALALVSALGCASPRSFDPREDGTGYQDTSYSSYQSCLDSLAPIGQATACAPASSGGAPRSGYGSGGGYRAGKVGLETGLEIGQASLSSSASTLEPNDPYFEAMKTWPEEERRAQEDAWRALAEQGLAARGLSR